LFDVIIALTENRKKQKRVAFGGKREKQKNQRERERERRQRERNRNFNK